MSSNRLLQSDDEDLRNLLRSAESILGTKIDNADSTQRYRASNVYKASAQTTTTPTLRANDLLSNQASGTSSNTSNSVDVKISREASDLATLLDSLSHDLKNELAQDTRPASSVEVLKPSWGSKQSRSNYPTVSSPASSFSAANSLQDSDIDIDIIDPSREVDSDGFSAEESSGAYDNVSVVRFCKEFSLRGKHGLYLTAVSNSSSSSAPPSLPISSASVTGSIRETGSAAAAQQYLLGAEGQGIGDPLDCLQFININQKDDTGPVRYGMVVSIKAPSAKERLLGLRDGTKLGFWRNLVGQGEKWVVLKAATVATGGLYYQQAAATISSNSSSSKVSFEEPNSKGSAVRLGDMILLQTFKTDHLLTLQTAAETAGANSASASSFKDTPGGTSYSVELVYKDRNMVIGLGLPDAELWQIGQFGSIPIPLWCRNRPYLSGSYLSMPPSLKPIVSELEIRAFPAANLNSVTASGAAVSLNSLSLATQHLILLRELLSSLSGVEGVYIKVKAQNNKGNGSSSGVNNTGGGLRSNQSLQLSLALDTDAADRSIASLVTQLLPVCEGAFKVRTFIRQQSQYEYGMVSHAFCAAVRRIVRDFDALVAQMEHLYIQQNLSLQKMLFLLQPSKVTLYQLERLCLRLSGLTGGHFLEVLHGIALEQGDKKAREMHIHLLEESYKPFLRMLQQWIDRGELLDPYKEFMVLEDSSVSKEALQEDFNAHYWDSRYKLQSTHIPRLLQTHAVKLLSAGKFLNVIRGAVGRVDLADQDLETKTTSTAGLEDTKESDQPLQLSLEASDSPMLRTIERAYVRSSSGILNLLEKGHGLSDHLNSLRRFFLLEHGDFFIQFMDSADEELRKDVKEVSLQRIQALLQLAVQTSTLASDPHREDLTCSLASHNLIQHLHLIQSAGDGSTSADHIGVVGQGLKGVEALTLDYKVGWPLSIVLSRRAITKYQLLSRLLYFSKHVERRVLSSWMDHQYTKLLRMHIRVVMGPCYCLRHRMLHFLQNFVYYMTLEVIGPRGHELQHDLSIASDMDDVLELHEKFLDSCLKECLLASQELLKILTKIMTTCLLFADYMRKFSVSHGDSHSSSSGGGSGSHGSSYYSSFSAGGKRNSNGVDKDEAAARAAAYVQYVEKEISHDSFNKMLAKFTETFDTQLKEFLDKLWTDSYRRHAQLSNLCIRLDYNGFYSSQYAT